MSWNASHNISLALRIMLTIPTTTVSATESYLKLKVLRILFANNYGSREIF